MTFSLLVLVGGLVGYQLYQSAHRYDLSSEELSLLSKPTVDLNYVKNTNLAVSYNAQDQAKVDTASQIDISNPADATGSQLYTASINKKASDGVTFGDAGGLFSFSIKPLDNLSSGLYKNGQTIFAGSNGSHQVLTFKRNGIKEDILVPKDPTTGSASYSW
jgi:hypothetical protein